MESKKRPTKLSSLFSEIYQGRTAWALDWIGDPNAFSPVGGRSVNAYLSERQAGMLPDIEHQIRISIKFEELAELRAPWRAQVPPLLTHGDHYELDIDPGSVLICTPPQPASAAKSHDLVPLPEWPYRLGASALSGAQHSRLVAVADPLGIDPLFCVIPCMEIIRHFFCTSRHLARHLLTGWEDLLVPEGCDAPRETMSVRIQVRPGLGTTFEDAATLAAYVASAWWRKVANSVRRQLQHASLQRSPAGPACVLPLRRECTLGVEAIAMRTDTELGKRFYVTRIVTAPRPFDLQEAWIQFGPFRGRHRPDLPIHDPWRTRPPIAPPPVRLFASRW